MKSIIITLTALLSFSAITEQPPTRKFEKVVDNDKRRAYYSECKQLKQNKCHYSSFEKSIVLKEILI
jgi:hypothetical protein